MTGAINVGFFNKTNNTNDTNDKNDSNNSEQYDFRRNHTRLNFRLIGCAALGYIAFNLFRTPSPEDGMNPLIRIGAATIFLGFAIVMGIFTLKEQSRIRKAEKAHKEEMALLEESESANEDYEDEYDDYEDEDDYEDDEDGNEEDSEVDTKDEDKSGKD